MAGGATTLELKRDAVEALLENVPGLKVYDHSPRDLDELPAVEMLLPYIRRVGLDEADSELGSSDWILEYPLRLHVALDDPETAADDALALVGQIVGVVDANPTLGVVDGTVADARILEADGGYALRDPEGNPLSRPKVVYDLTLGALLLVS
jgi:hypothetical protein